MQSGGRLECSSPIGRVTDCLVWNIGGKRGCPPTQSAYGATTEMEFRVDREMDEHWYRVQEAVEAGTARQAVARSAKAEGTYRARPTEAPEARSELFSVPSWGKPVALSRR